MLLILATKCKTAVMSTPFCVSRFVLMFSAWLLLIVRWCLMFVFPAVDTDAISSSNPRVIDDARARKLSNDLKRCTYYETCATYGLNVERVFQDGKE